MWSWPLYSPLCQTKWIELVLNKCLNGSPFAQNVEWLPVVCRIKSKLYFLAFKPFHIIFCCFNLILYSLTLSSKYFLCNIPCSGTIPCVLPFPFPCLSKPIQKCCPVPGTVLISGVTVMNKTQDKVSVFVELTFGVRRGRRGTVNKYQVVMQWKRIKLDKGIEWWEMVAILGG